jgi:hypothetical protein
MLVVFKYFVGSGWRIILQNTLFAFIISLAKIIKRTLSNHDVLAWNNEHNTLVFALFLLIFSISIHLFIHLTTQERKKKKLCKISRYIVKRIFGHRYSGTE